MPVTLLTNDPDTLSNREAVAHNELVRMVARYPDSQTTYTQVLAQLDLVRDLNAMLDEDQQMDEDEAQ